MSLPCGVRGLNPCERLRRLTTAYERPPVRQPPLWTPDVSRTRLSAGGARHDVHVELTRPSPSDFGDVRQMFDRGFLTECCICISPDQTGWRRWDSNPRPPACKFDRGVLGRTTWRVWPDQWRLWRRTNVHERRRMFPKCSHSRIRGKCPGRRDERPLHAHRPASALPEYVL
jgi:hypothetical protein